MITREELIIGKMYIVDQDGAAEDPDKNYFWLSCNIGTNFDGYQRFHQKEWLIYLGIAEISDTFCYEPYIFYTKYGLMSASITNRHILPSLSKLIT